jgi:hypothetical protein
VSAEEAPLTAEEQAAFERIQAHFPGAELGERQPHTLKTRRRYERLSPRQAKIAAELEAKLRESSVLRDADRVLTASDGFRLAPVDLAGLLADGIPDTEWLEYPYLPVGSRVWVFGPAESAKTLYFQWVAAKLTRAGRIVVFVSQENPLATDVDRMGRLRPNHQRLRYFHNAGLDLADPDHFAELALACIGADLLVVDTLSASWSGDEASNADVVRLDREVLAPLVRLTGVTTVMIHHTGHPQALVNRGGVSAGRGASAMGQKADVVLVFSSSGPKEFAIDHAKNRTPGGHREPRSQFRVTDTEDGGLEIERVGKAIPQRVAEAMDAAVEIVIASEGLSTNALKEALKSRGFGSSTVDPALAELRNEDSARIRQADGDVVGRDGKRRKGRPWIAA